ncbi:hypothetical protein [Pedobacter mendelii]|uniref:Lipoprotein n=1 Tax=Pedobacter mendelii TaxID=1908240 RepID=A0ABQ2BM68_9SPHI|nr:hypothetical protein [Pedobacter mendelii]GGI29484.1 hypothetical protein GCM10008119_37860 [Pedobacter mendelii]
MKRSEFIRLTAKAALGLALTNSLMASCVSKGANISDLIGKNAAVLSGFALEYDGVLSCYSTAKFKSDIDGEKALIFCLNNKIVGFSIKLKTSSLTKKLKEKNGDTIFSNPFGSKIYWKEKKVLKSLCLPKDYGNIKSYVFYSEFAEEAATIVF